MAESEKENANLSEGIEDKSMKKESNPWKLFTVLFLVLSIVLIVLLVQERGVTGNVISSEDAEKQIIDALNSRVGGGITYISTEEEAGFYKITVGYQGNEIPVYVTKDGKYYTVQLTPLTGDVAQAQAQQQPAQNVPKTDKPVVEAFVFAYCPYGLQFEKAMLPVYKILKDKADLNIVFIGAMHGEYEKTESLRQLCIEKEYGKDKLWQYLEEFMGDNSIGDCNDDQQCSLPLVEGIMAKAGIDKSKIETCMRTNAEALYNVDSQRASELSVSGSPTFLINGVQASVSRSPDAIKKAICSAFNKAPAECEQAVSTEQASPWFGYETSGTSASGAQASC